MILICLTTSNARIVSYILLIDSSNDTQIEDDQELQLDNEIEIPSSHIMNFVFDTHRNIIIAIVKVSDTYF